MPHEIDVSKTKVARHAIRFGPRSEIELLVKFALRRHLANSRLIHIESEYSGLVDRATDACVAAAAEKRTVEEIVALLEDRRLAFDRSLQPMRLNPSPPCPGSHSP